MSVAGGGLTSWLCAAGETMEEVSLTSEVGEELKEIVRQSYLDEEFDSKWLPAKIQLIHNSGLQSVYDGLLCLYSPWLYYLNPFIPELP